MERRRVNAIFICLSKIGDDTFNFTISPNGASLSLNQPATFGRSESQLRVIFTGNKTYSSSVQSLVRLIWQSQCERNVSMVKTKYNSFSLNRIRSKHNTHVRNAARCYHAGDALVRGTVFIIILLVLQDAVQSLRITQIDRMLCSVVDVDMSKLNDVNR